MALRERFQQLVDDQYDGLWPYVSYLTGGGPDCEDLVHQAFLLAFDRLAAGEEFTGDPGKWLRGTARNLVHAWWRERRGVPEKVAAGLRLLAEESEDPASAIAAAEAQDALAYCLDKLSEEDRALIARRYEDGLRITQIAEQMKSKAATIRVRLFRIRQALKLCVEGRL